MDFSALFAPLTTWLDAHPGAVAWLLAWIAALGAAQTVKQLLLPTYWTRTETKRATQVIAMLIGTVVSFMLWPAGSPHPGVDALIVGMSAPTAYTLIKAVIEARWPRLAYALSWDAVQERRGDDASPPECRP